MCRQPLFAGTFSSNVDSSSLETDGCPGTRTSSSWFLVPEKKSWLLTAIYHQSNLIQRHESKACFRKCSRFVFPCIKNGHCVVLSMGLNFVKVTMTIDDMAHFCNHLDNCTGTGLSQNKFRAWNFVKCLPITTPVIEEGLDNCLLYASKIKNYPKITRPFLVVFLF